MPEQIHKKFNNYLTRLGLKITRQREVITSEFLQHKGHLSAEQLFLKVRRIDAKVSLASVYRTLKLLAESGLAASHRFGEGFTSFEPKTDSDGNHHHIICLKCWKIVEFLDSEIEKRQTEIARRYGFRNLNHKLELYGHCASCDE